MKKIVPNHWAYIVIVLTGMLVALLFLYFLWPINWQETECIEVVDKVGSSSYESAKYMTVMLDNSYEVLPQIGLEKAAVVYEALIEGGFTRLMAVFNTADLPEDIGPIRSARPYFLDWANEWSGSYWHAGGSPQALHALKYDEWTFSDINEISYLGRYFYRSRQYKNPHNLFTNSESINDVLKKYEINSHVDYPWEIKDDLAKDFRTSEDKYVHIPYTQEDVYWYYERDSNEWYRYIDDEQQLYSDNNTIAVKNVIVLVVETRLIDIERLGMDTIGQGSGFIFRDGQKQEINWRKQSKGDKLELLAGSRPVQLNFGNTWIQILPQYLKLKYN